jgi:hypothetical protein
MTLRWLIPLAVLLPLRLGATDTPVKARIETLVINPAEITPLHLRPGFISTIRMPEEVNSVAVGNRGEFTADHNEGEPLYVYVHPLTKAPAQSNLVIATKSGLHVELELISDGNGGANSTQAVDFLLEYRPPHNFLISDTTSIEESPNAVRGRPISSHAQDPATKPASGPSSSLDEEYAQQIRINAPNWTKWPGQQIETSVGDVRQWSNQTVVSYSIYNGSDQPVEIVPPQVQITGHKIKKKGKEGKEIIDDQLEIRDYRLSATRLGPGERADGVVLFDRPSFKQSTEKLFVQIAQADQVDRPILIRLPFTPPISGNAH